MVVGANLVSDPSTAQKVEITELVNRYFAALDQKHFDLTTMSGLFAPDARIVRPNRAATLGPQAIAESHARSLSRFRATQHLTSGFVVVLAEDQQAADIRANLVAIHLWAEGHGDPGVDPSDNYFVAGGVITGCVALTSEGWRITELANQVTWRRGTGFEQMLATR